MYIYVHVLCTTHRKIGSFDSMPKARIIDQSCLVPLTLYRVHCVDGSVW